jgi:hypothetical protein
MEGRRPRVLVLDINPSYLSQYALLLEAGGFDPVQMLSTSFSTEARVPDIDLVALNYQPTELSAAVNLVREVEERYPKAPIVLLTAFPLPHEELRPHITTFVQRWSPEELLAALWDNLP